MAAGAALGAAAIHAYVAPEHLREWWLYGGFFIGVTAVQLALAWLVLRRPTVTVLLGGIWGTVALIGIYGITAYAVTQRTRELGLRMAIGARPAEVVGLLLKENLWLVLGGLVLGTTGATLATRALRSMLFGVSTLDAITFVGAALVLGGVAMLATYVPARRAARIDPMVALRYE